MNTNPSHADFIKQLTPKGDFYICSDFSQEMIGPSVLEIHGHVYHRFMNYLYLPARPENLSIPQIIAICDLRSDHIEDLLDLQFNDAIINTVASCIDTHFPRRVRQLTALDFGCGTGLSSTLMAEKQPDLKIIGVDISEKAITQSHQRGLAALLVQPYQRLPFDALSFDVIFAIFVMHFNSDIFIFNEARRILKRNGIFVFNIYKRNISEFLQKTRSCGFDNIQAIDVHDHPQGSHKILMCE